MRKVIACFLTIALVLFAFTACENKTSTPDVGETTIPDPGTTTAPKATTEQLFLLQELYKELLLRPAQYMMETPPLQLKKPYRNK